MKLAIMMRSMDQDSGFHAITAGEVEGLIRNGPEHRFLLLYRTSKHFGRFAGYANVKEVLVRPKNLLLWDQLGVPWRAWRERADAIFNPKFSVPLISLCPVFMGLQEPAWWIWPQYYEWLDLHYMRLMLPIYIRKARWLFPISQFTVDETDRLLKLDVAAKATISYAAPKPQFQRIKDPLVLQAFREKYALPAKFITTVTRVSHILDRSDSFFEGKYPHATLAAFIECRDRIPEHSLVIAGRRVREFMLHKGYTEADFERVRFLDFVEHEDLPKLHSLSALFVIPSPYESFAMAMVEAIACGCPVVAADEGAVPEIAGGAALLVSHRNPAQIGEAIVKVLTDPVLAASLSAQSLERAAFFNWDRTTMQILRQLEKILKPTVNR